MEDTILKKPNDVIFNPSFGLEFLGGLRESADLRKQNFTPALFTEDGSLRDGPLLIFCTRSEIMQQIGNDRRQEIRRLDFLVHPDWRVGMNNPNTWIFHHYGQQLGKEHHPFIFR